MILRQSLPLWAAVLILSLQACTPAPQAVKPVVTHNQQNLTELENNVQVLLSLYEPLLQASSKALIYQHISTVRKDLIGLVGASTFGAVTDDWDSLFNKSRVKELKDRYHYVHSALKRGISDTEQQQLRRREGWIYTAVAHAEVFTPHVAQELIKKMAELQKNSPDLSYFFSLAEEHFLPYDGTLAHYRQTTDGARELFLGLRQEILTQLATATTLGQALHDYADTQLNRGDVAAGLSSSQVSEILNQVGSKYIKDDNTRQAAIDLFTHGVGSLLK
jgi:hypothetical protein